VSDVSKNQILFLLGAKNINFNCLLRTGCNWMAVQRLLFCKISCIKPCLRRRRWDERWKPFLIYRTVEPYSNPWVKLGTRWSAKLSLISTKRIQVIPQVRDRPIKKTLWPDASSFAPS